MWTDEANKVIYLFEKKGSVCPSILKNVIFTIGNLDDIDHNRRPSSSYDAFYGTSTALSVTQNATHMNIGSVSEGHWNVVPPSYVKIFFF